MGNSENDGMTWERRGRGWTLTVTAITFFLLAGIYGAVNQWAGMRGVTAWDPKQAFVLADGTFLDRRIPVLPWSIHVYNTLFLFYWLPACVMPASAKAHQQLVALMQSLVGMLLVACAFFLFLPACIDMRDQVQHALAEPGVWVGHVYAFKAIHYLDTPYNSWPCQHIAQPILVCGVVTYWHWQKHPLRIIFLWIFCALVGVSILTTKQHFIWDVATGTLMGSAVLCWLLTRFHRIEKLSGHDGTGRR